ncbi:MAG: hypothetical protein COB33_015810 [Thiotrichaceae bacterium]|nr:hypothetical protein [Thiotrichaceae bacterium]
MTSVSNLFNAAQQCLSACDVTEKLCLTRHVAQQWRDGGYTLATQQAAALIGVLGTHRAQSSLHQPTCHGVAWVVMKGARH